jgi:DNA-binding CsgD family transcriptional regulator
MQSGILICDASFRISYINRAGERMVDEVPGIYLGPERLLSFRDREMSHRFTTGLLAAVRASLEKKDIADEVLKYEGGNHTITVVISPLTAHDGNRRETSRGGAMISLHDWSARPEIDVSVIKSFFDLTNAEADVARRLAEGSSLADIARATKRTRETIKSHLKALFEKTNTSRQGELVALLAATRPLR